MTLEISTPFLPAATVNLSYSTQLGATGGIAPYQFAVISGTMPSGLTMSSSGLITGVPTQLGLSSLVIEVSDSTAPVQQTLIQTFQLTVLDLTNLSALTVDQAQFVQQFQQVLANTGTWSTGITAQTSQTLIELISAIGTFLTAKINRVKEDAFPETAQSDSAILAVANMQGIRLSRRMPATVPVTLVSTVANTIPPYTQFSGSGYNWFNTEQIVLNVNVPVTAVLKEGTLVSTNVTGLGSDLQTWVSPDGDFSVSDQDVVLRLNGTQLYKAFGGLWNYPRSSTGGGSVQNAYADRTLSDGRLLIQFGSGGYGAIPGVNDVVNITYAKTEGSSLNSVVLAGGAVTAVGYPTITGTFVSNPSGGAEKKNTVAYKNFSSGTFGTFSSGVTKAQYQALVNNYPGIVDAVTQAQREINPAALEWMNIIRVSALTSSPWSQVQINDFIKYAESVTMYSTKFIWQEPARIGVTVNLSIYCFNSVTSLSAVSASVEAAVTKLLTARPGLLMTDFYESDLIETAMNAAPGQISYVVVNSPTQPMIVSAPKSPVISAHVDPFGGSLPPSVYSYAVAASTPAPNTNFVALLNASTLTYYPNATAAGQYWIVSHAGHITDPITAATVAVNIGDQLSAVNLGNTSDNFIVILYASNSVIDVGAPTSWTYPQVTVSGSTVTLDWSATKVSSAIQYFVWGRKAGELGIVATLNGDVTSFIDYGVAGVAPVPVSAYSTTAIRYNALDSLQVNAQYSSRQSNALFPVRDTL